MNAPTTIEQPGDTPGMALITPETIHDMVAGRDLAIVHWLAAYDDFHIHTGAAKIASIGGAVSLPLGQSYGSRETALTSAFMAPATVDVWTADGSSVKRPAREMFHEKITAEIDRRCWRGLMEQVGGDKLMDRQAREEFRKGLEGTPAPFTFENCTATFGHLWENRRALFLRGIANTFSKLDRRFRSHDGFKIGARLILDYALDDYGSWRNYERRDTFEDVERLLHELDEKPGPDRKASITGKIGEAARHKADLPTVIHGDYFRVRVFKNGNLHIWFEREDLLRKVNLLLAEYYGEALGDGQAADQAEAEPGYHLTPAKNFGAFNTSPDLAQWIDRYAEIGKGQRVLEPSAGTGELAKMARRAGAEVTCVEIQPGLAHELAAVHGFADTRCADFLTLTPADLYDVVLMNPPFDRGRDCDHVRHAWQFVKPGGKLVAIMSARAEYGDDARHKALHRIVEAASPAYGHVKWIDLPPGSFAHAGTQVNTVLLVLRKPHQR